MKLTSVALTGAVLGLARASPITKRQAISDGMLKERLLEEINLHFLLSS